MLRNRFVIFIHRKMILPGLGLWSRDPVNFELASRIEISLPSRWRRGGGVFFKLRRFREQVGLQVGIFYGSAEKEI
jgi:hypothetical protein